MGFHYCCALCTELSAPLYQTSDMTILPLHGKVISSFCVGTVIVVIIFKKKTKNIHTNIVSSEVGSKVWLWWMFGGEKQAA